MIWVDWIDGDRSRAEANIYVIKLQSPIKPNPTPKTLIPSLDFSFKRIITYVIMARYRCAKAACFKSLRVGTRQEEIIVSLRGD